MSAQHTCPQLWRIYLPVYLVTNENFKDVYDCSLDKELSYVFTYLFFFAKACFKIP